MENYDIKQELLKAKIREAEHRNKMNYYKEVISLIEKFKDDTEIKIQ